MSIQFGSAHCLREINNLRVRQSSFFIEGRTRSQYFPSLSGQDERGSGATEDVMLAPEMQPVDNWGGLAARVHAVFSYAYTSI